MEAHLLRELSAREVRDEKERTARRTQASESSKGAKVTEWPPEEDSDEEEITTVRKIFRNILILLLCYLCCLLKTSFCFVCVCVCLHRLMCRPL